MLPMPGGQKRLERGVRKMSSSITVYYESADNSFSVYLTNINIYQAQTEKGKGVYFKLTEDEAKELELKLNYEKILENFTMTQEEANKEQVIYDEKGRPDDY